MVVTLKKIHGNKRKPARTQEKKFFSTVVSLFYVGFLKRFFT